MAERGEGGVERVRGGGETNLQLNLIVCFVHRKLLDVGEGGFA